MSRSDSCGGNLMISRYIGVQLPNGREQKVTNEHMGL